MMSVCGYERGAELCNKSTIETSDHEWTKYNSYGASIVATGRGRSESYQSNKRGLLLDAIC
jgi:hypothetical protein